MVQSVHGADVVVLCAQFVVQRLGIKLALLASQLLRPAFTSEAQVLLYLVQVGRQLGFVAVTNRPRCVRSTTSQLANLCAGA